MRGLILNLIKTVKIEKKEIQKYLALQGPKRVKKFFEHRYLTENCGAKYDLAEEWLTYLIKLENDGYVVIPNSFALVADKILENLDIEKLNSFNDETHVIDYCFDLGFSFPGIFNLMSNKELCSLLCNFFGRQALYRNHPQIISHSRGVDTLKRSSEFSHIDGYKQLTMFLLLSDMNETTSQLYIYPNSHKTKSYTYNRSIRIDQSKQFENVLGITAQKGDLVIFNSGSLWHKGLSRESRRLILNIIITTGWIPTPDSENYDSDYLKINLKGMPEYVSKCFTGFFPV